MKQVKVVKVDSEGIDFDNGARLRSHHDQNCCESHYLDFSDLDLRDFEGLEFDLSGEDFFERLEDYGIALKPLNGHPVRVPGYGSNNGYYSSELILLISTKEGFEKEFDITECQDYEPY